MLVAGEHVIERVDVDEHAIDRDPPGVHLRHNTLEPMVLSDGVDFVAVIDEGDDVYRLEYWGYEFGRLRVTPAGVEEIGDMVATNTRSVPTWTVDPDTVDPDEPPWWLPDDLELPQTATCEVCDEECFAQDVFTPRKPRPPEHATVICQDCWDD